MMRSAIGWLLEFAMMALIAILLASVLVPSLEYSVALSNFWPHLGLALAACGAFRAGCVKQLWSAARILLGLAFVAYAFFSVRPVNHQEIVQANAPLKIVTFNLRNDNRRNADRLMDFLISLDADFVFLQEAGAIEGSFDRLLAHYPHKSGCEPGTDCSMLLLSHHPFEAVERPDGPPGSHRFAIVRSRVNDVAINVVGLHLTKPLMRGRQTREIDHAAARISKLRDPVIVAGDFNAAPWSLSMRRFLAGTGLRLPYGYRPTWPTWLPFVGLPLDHVLVRGSLSVGRIDVLSETIGSNHRPVIAYIDLPGN
ncbi:MAG: endonuclease/exonuclease/phosphatase family protein [Hyphomicrobiaceae bacterium]